VGNIKGQLKKIVRTLPFGSVLLAIVRSLRETPPSFDGWGLKTYHRTPPWIGMEEGLGKSYSIVNDNVIESGKNGQLSLSQFAGSTDLVSQLRELSWRHFIIFWSVQHVFRNIDISVRKNLVECGVCDGLTILYALRAMDNLNQNNYRSYLYDSWQPMTADLLRDSEAKNIGAYSYLSIDSTKRNLADYASRTVFCQGFIPDSFKIHCNPDEISWLHIDLNASIATQSTLEFFFPRLERGGCIVFDDYGSNNYRDTKLVVERFFRDKGGSLLPLPTGQAIYFKT
jgi:O-methyltransferase